MNKDLEYYQKKLKIAEQKVRILEDMIENRTRDLHLQVKENEHLEHFAYLSSHDMKEPLRTIKSFAQILEEDYSDMLNEKGLMYVRFIIEGADRLTEMIIGLLEYSSLGRNKVKKIIDCNEIIGEVMQNLDSLIQDTHAKISYNKLPTVNAYQSEFKLLFQNLIQNAIKFRKAESDPDIEISAKLQGGEYIFSVKDNGIGIEMNHYQKIFEMFQRLHTREKYEGTGMGLANCRKIVEFHDGRIWVESQRGHGSTFFFTIQN